MHELLLYGQVPAARHEQLLSILAGLTAMQPRRIVERRAIYRPIKTPSTNVIQRGGTQGVQTTPKQPQNQRVTDLNLLYLVKSVDEKEFGQLVDLTGSSEDAVESLTESERLWTFELQDTPEPGKRPVAMRYTHLTEIAEGDPNKFMQDLGYRYIKEFLVEGHRFVLNNVIIFLHRILQYPNPNPEPNLRTSLPPLNSLKPLDPSGSYLVEVKLRVSDGSKASLVAQGQQEMERFQNRMEGVVDLKVPDRLALDTRVK